MGDPDLEAALPWGEPLGSGWLYHARRPVRRQLQSAVATVSLRTDPHKRLHSACCNWRLHITKFGLCGPCASKPPTCLPPRPEVPPLEELPGPGAAAFSGLDAYIRLMEDCWAQEPQDRPSFEDVVPRLRWDGLPCCSTRYPCILEVCLRSLGVRSPGASRSAVWLDWNCVAH